MSIRAKSKIAFLLSVLAVLVLSFQNCSSPSDFVTADATSKAPGGGGGHGGYDGKVYVHLATNQTCVDGDAAFARVLLDLTGRYHLVRWNCATRNDVIEVTRITDFDELVVAGKRFEPEVAASPAAPNNLRYGETSAIYLIGSTISQNVPTVSGAVDSYTVTPALPAGLTLDSSSGRISGTPTEVSAAANYMVTASNASDSTFAFVRIRTSGGFRVDSLADAADASPGDGTCATTTNSCSLRAAVQEANSSPSSNDVVLLPAGTIVLGGSEIALAGNIEIVGSGSSATIIDGNNASRIFNASTRSNDTIVLSELTLQRGASPGDGGCMYLLGNRLVLENVTAQNCTAGGSGGAIGIFDDFKTKAANLSISNSVFRNNTASTAFGPSSVGGGGALYFWSEVPGTSASIVSTTFTNNSAKDMGGGLTLVAPNGVFASNLVSGNTLTVAPGANHGGGGLILWYGSYVLRNNTISGNIDETGSGALQTNNQVDLTLVNNTIVGNRSNNCPGYNSGGFSGNSGLSGTISNNIFNDNLCSGAKKNCAFAAASVSSRGSNLSDTASSDCNTSAAGDLNDTTALLGPLQNNGGPSPTMALLSGSPGVDSGSMSSCPLFDQRNYPRITGLGCDIGAYEAQ